MAGSPPVTAAEPVAPTPVGTYQTVPAAQPQKKAEDQAAIDRVTTMWSQSKQTFLRNKWLGIPTLQNPMDVWVTQEILFEIKPDFLVETGTFLGDSAALWATILEQINPKARVITIDVEDRLTEARKLPIVKKRVDFLLGSSADPKIVNEVKKRVKGRSTVVILDSLHTKEHVLAELRAYAPIVPVGSYMIVQDSIFNGHPAPEGWGPGPYEAVEEFLKENDSFVVDRDRERLMITFNPMGFLRRTK
jgi:cephalosporin hydroxylase